VASRVARSVLCLPMSSHMREADVDGVCEAVRRAHEWASDLRRLP
jgi:dTDP-4-amino-4,6-dideoxygalactose transaminase